jgi:hypothetical protein
MTHETSLQRWVNTRMLCVHDIEFVHPFSYSPHGDLQGGPASDSRALPKHQHRTLLVSHVAVQHEHTLMLPGKPYARLQSLLHKQCDPAC